jgi:NDP-sugar pyrophosphorylase family protein
VAAWPALVLAAGFGTRMRPLSYVRAKAAMPVAGVPLVCRILDWLAAQGVADVVVNLHHLPDTVREAVGSRQAVIPRVRYSPEDPILGSAGGPRRALRLLEADRFFIVNGDTLCDVDLRVLADRHVATKALVTMALVPNPDSRRYGGVLVDDEGVVQGFTRRGDARGLHFVGVQAVETSVFEHLPDDRPSESVGRVYPALMADRPGSVRALCCRATFRDIGTPGDYLAATLALAAEEGHPETLPGRFSRVDSTAHVIRTVVWNHVTVGPGARLVECVVADGVTVPSGAHFARRAIVAREGREPREEEIVEGDLLTTSIDLPLGTGERTRP